MEHANPAAVALILLFLVPVFVSIARAKRGHPIYIRRIPGIDAIENAVGRAVELGRPISFTTALTGVGPLFYACLSALRHIARKAAVFNAKLIVPSSDPEAMVLTEATLQTAYRDERRSHRFDPTTVRYLSSEQFAFSSGYMGTVHRENVGSAFLFGSFTAESLILAEAGQQVGALQVAATPSLEQTPFFLTSCDYTLIGDEIFATGAFLSDDPVQRGSLRGQDYAKASLLALLVLGTIFTTLTSVLSGAPSRAINTALNARWSDLFPAAPANTPTNEKP
jgi:hypothetical protein